MSIKQPYSTSLRSVGAYQVSGRPFLKGGMNASSSTATVIFPFVTRWVVITNSGDTNIKVTFAPDKGGVSDGCYLEILAGQTTPRLEIKCAELHLHGGENAACLSVMAGLTNVPRDQMYTLAGEGIDKSI